MASHDPGEGLYGKVSKFSHMARKRGGGEGVRATPPSPPPSDRGF